MQSDRRLVRAVSDGSLIPTFDQWLENSGYRDSVRWICAHGTLAGQVYAMRSLYKMYKEAVDAR